MRTQGHGPYLGWWQVQDSNLRSFRDGFTVRRSQRVDVHIHGHSVNFRTYYPQTSGRSGSRQASAGLRYRDDRAGQRLFVILRGRVVASRAAAVGGEQDAQLRRAPFDSGGPFAYGSDRPARQGQSSDSTPSQATAPSTVAAVANGSGTSRCGKHRSLKAERRRSVTYQWSPVGALRRSSVVAVSAICVSGVRAPSVAGC